MSLDVPVIFCGGHSQAVQLLSVFFALCEVPPLRLHETALMARNHQRKTRCGIGDDKVDVSDDILQTWLALIVLERLARLPESKKITWRFFLNLVIPKWMVYIRKSHLQMDDSGVPPLFM